MDCGINLFVFIGQTNETYHEIFDIDNNISLGGITLFENIKDNKFGKFVNELIIYFTTNKKVKPRYILVHDREHTFLHFTTVPSVQDNLFVGLQVEYSSCFRVQTQFLVVVNFCLRSIE